MAYQENMCSGEEHESAHQKAHLMPSGYEMLWAHMTPWRGCSFQMDMSNASKMRTLFCFYLWYSPFILRPLYTEIRIQLCSYILIWHAGYYVHCIWARDEVQGGRGSAYQKWTILSVNYFQIWTDSEWSGTAEAYVMMFGYVLMNTTQFC